MIRRRTAGLAAASVLLLAALSGCAGAASPSDGVDGQAWTQELLGQSGSGVGGPVSAEADAGSRMDFAAPTTLRSVELRCLGTDRAQFTLTYTGAGGSLSATQDIVCHGGEPRTPIAVPTSVGALTAFAATATSPDGKGFWVAIPQG